MTRVTAALKGRRRPWARASRPREALVHVGFLCLGQKQQTGYGAGRCPQRGHVPHGLCPGHPGQCSASPAIFQSTPFRAGRTSDVSMAMGLAYVKCLDSNTTGTRASSRFTTLGKHRGSGCFFPPTRPPEPPVTLILQARTAHCPSGLTSRAQEPESHPSFNVSTHSVFPATSLSGENRCPRGTGVLSPPAPVNTPPPTRPPC